MTTIVLTDAASTPVNHSFPPVIVDPDSGTDYQCLDSNGSLTGAMKIHLQLRQNGDQTSRVIGKLSVPVLETIEGDTEAGYAAVPKTAFTDIGSFELVFPARAGLQNRKDLYAMLKDLLQDAVVQAMVESFTRPT